MSVIGWSANGLVFEAEIETDAVPWLTTWLMVTDVLAVKLVSPEYTAVIESVPAGRVVVVRVATPSDRFSVPELRRAAWRR